MNATYKIILSYLAMLLGAVLLTDSLQQFFIIGSVIIVLCIIHLRANVTKRHRMDWGRINQPLAIIDRGMDGHPLSLPKHLDGQWIAVPASKVQRTKKDAERQLAVSQNPLYLKRGLPVYAIYFRKGEHCNESPTAYQNRVIEIMNAQRVKWHKALDRKMPDYYLEVYLERT